MLNFILRMLYKNDFTLKQSVVDDNKFIGFDNPLQALQSAFGLFSEKNFFIECLFAIFGISIAFIDSYIFNPYQKLLILWVFLLADYITAIVVSFKITKEGFNTRKGQRIVFLFLSYAFAMSASFWLDKYAHETYFWLPYALFSYLSGVLLISIFKNLSLLKLLPKGIASFIQKYIDTHKDRMVDAIKQNQIEELNK
jgi:phage-related holin